MVHGRVVINTLDQYKGPPDRLVGKMAKSKQTFATFQCATDVNDLRECGVMAWAAACYGQQHTRLHFIGGNVNGQGYQDEFLKVR